MEPGKQQQKHLHLAMIPWLAFGHLIPFLQLSISLARAGFRISFLSSPRNIQRLLPKLPQDLTSEINLVELPLPHVDDLHEGAEATVDLPTLNDEYLKKAYDLLLTQPFELFLAQESPDFIIHDILTHWTSDISHRFGIPRVLFSTSSAGPLAFLGLLEPAVSVDDIGNRMATPEALMSPPPWIPFPSSLALLPHEAQMFRVVSNTDASGISFLQRAISAIQGCDAIVLRSCHEYEGDYLGVLKKYPKPVIPIGLLPPEKIETAVVGEHWERMFRWLDGKPRRSVVFVVFGSECKLSRSEVDEIAHGLELSELGFLWALRRPEWAAADDSDALPPGFVTRTMGRGVVNLGWAPQVDVLAHPAIGGCLFHAGWSMIIEAVHFGHPLVLLPFANVQGFDARVAVEKGVGVEVERHEDGTFRREAIAGSLRRAMVDEQGKDLRLRSREMMAIFSDQRLHQRYLNGFIDFLREYKIK